MSQREAQLLCVAVMTAIIVAIVHAAGVFARPTSEVEVRNLHVTYGQESAALTWEVSSTTNLLQFLVEERRGSGAWAKLAYLPSSARSDTLTEPAGALALRVWAVPKVGVRESTGTVTGKPVEEEPPKEEQFPCGSPNITISTANTTLSHCSAQSITIAASGVTLEQDTVEGAANACVTVNPGLAVGPTIKLSLIRKCGGSGIDYSRTTGTYTKGGSVVGNTIKEVGQSNHAADDLDVVADGVTFEGNDISSSPNDAVDLWGNGLTFRHDKIHDISNPYGNHNDVWQSWRGVGGFEGHPLTNLTIERETVNNITGSNSHVLIAEGGGYENWTIRSNVFANVGSAGLIIGKNASEGGSNVSSMMNVKVSDNTFYKTGDADSAVKFNSARGSGVVASNIFYSSGYYHGGEASVTKGYDDFYGANGSGSSGDTTSNPLLVNPAGGDFHETSSSPTVNTGDNGALVPIRPVDLEGKPTSGVVDRGAYEF